MASKKKKIPSILKIALIFIIAVFAVSQADTFAIPVLNAFNAESGSDSDTLTIGAFNIQVFGTTKADKADVMEILSQVIRDYDIIAIEEIRDSSGTALPKLIELVNSDGSSYSYFVSERLGRTSSKESYAYIYNTKTVEPVITPFTYPEAENTDPFHREPYIGSFKSAEGIFNATFVVIHTDPDEAKEEIDALYEVSEYAKTVFPYDETIVIMGDFNADGSYFNEDSYTPMKSGGYMWIIENSLDTTTGTTDCTYDRIVLTGSNNFYAGDAGVFRFDIKYQLTDDFTKQVSDHYPVYAVFSKGITDEKSYFSAAETISAPSSEKYSENNEIAYTNIAITGLNVCDNWVTITNTGSEIVDIGNFRLSDGEEKTSYIFPAGLTIPPEGMITLYSGTGNNSDFELYWGVTEDIWDDTGDTAKLFDNSGKLVSVKVS